MLTWLNGPLRQKLKRAVRGKGNKIALEQFPLIQLIVIVFKLYSKIL